MESLLERLDSTVGDGLVHVVIDTPAGSRAKFKYDAKCSCYRLSRLLPHGMAFPYNFGSVPRTVAEDGDPLDVLVAVIDTDFSDAELKRMAELGVVGVRVNFGTPQSWGPTTAARLETTANRIADLGWHTQVFAPADQIVELEPVLKRLPTQLVIDHLGKLPPARGLEHPAYPVIRGLLDGGSTWVKLSGAYLNTRVGPPKYPDATEMARAYAKAAPERVLWGSDWPHRGEKEMPDDAALFDLLLEWAPDDRARRLILVDNPQALYRFGPT